MTFQRRLEFADPASVARWQPKFREMLANLAKNVYDKSFQVDAFQFAPVPVRVLGFPGDVVTTEEYSTENQENWAPSQFLFESQSSVTRGATPADLLFEETLYNITAAAWPSSLEIENIVYEAGTDYSITLSAGWWIIDWSIGGNAPALGTVYVVPFKEDITQITIGSDGDEVIGWYLDGPGLNNIRGIYNQAQFIPDPLTIKAFNFYLWLKAYAQIWQGQQDEADQIYLDGYIGWPKRYVLNVLKGEEDGKDPVASNTKYHLKTEEGAQWIDEIEYNDVAYVKDLQWDIVEEDGYFKVDWNVGNALMPWQLPLRRTNLGDQDVLAWDRKYRTPLTLADNIIAGNDGYTTLLLHCNGVDAATTFPDASGFSNVLTPVGGAAVDAGYKRFGSGSLFLNGTTAELTMPPTLGVDFSGGEDHTIDACIRFNAVPTGTNVMAIFLDANGSVRFFVQGDGAGGHVLKYQLFNGGPPCYLAEGPITIVPDTWYHVGGLFYENEARVLFDGAVVGSGTQQVLPTPGPCGVIHIGSNGGGGQFFDGWIDEIRVSKGIARWKKTTYTVPTEPYESYDSAALYEKGTDYAQSTTANLTFNMVKGRAGSRDIIGAREDYPIISLPATLLIGATTYQKGRDYKLTLVSENWTVDWNTGAVGETEPVLDTAYSLPVVVSEIHSIDWGIGGSEPISGTDYVAPFTIPSEPPAGVTYPVQFDGALVNTDLARMQALKDNWTNFLRIDFPSWILKTSEARRFIAMILDAYTWANTKEGLILGAQAFHPDIPEPVFFADWDVRRGFLMGHDYISHDGSLKPDLFRYFVAGVERDGGGNIIGITPFNDFEVLEVDLRNLFVNDTETPKMADNLVNLIKVKLQPDVTPKIQEFWLYRQLWTDTRDKSDRLSYHVVKKVRFTDQQYQNLTNHWYTVKYLGGVDSLFGKTGKIISQTETHFDVRWSDGTEWSNRSKTALAYKVEKQAQSEFIFADDGRTITNNLEIVKGAVPGEKVWLFYSADYLNEITSGSFPNTIVVNDITWTRGIDFEFVEEDIGTPDQAWYIDWSLVNIRNTPPVTHVAGGSDPVLPVSNWDGTSMTQQNFQDAAPMVIGPETYPWISGYQVVTETISGELWWVVQFATITIPDPPIGFTYHVPYANPKPAEGTVYNIPLDISDWMNENPAEPGILVDLPHYEVEAADSILIRQGTARIMYMSMLVDLTNVAEQVSSESEQTEFLTAENLFELRASMETVLQNVALSTAAMKIVFIIPSGRNMITYAEEGSYVL